MKARSIGKWHKENCKIWGKLIRLRAGNKCEICGRAGKIDAHHFACSKKYKNVAYDLRNGVALCFVDHRLAHDSPAMFFKLMEKIMPERYFLKDELIFKANESRKIYAADLEIINTALKSLLAQKERGNGKI